jgi:CBS domain-containing protein
MHAVDVMTTNVISTTADASILKAVQLMLQHRISGLPVVDAAGTLVGMVTEGDFLRRAETGTARRRPRWLEFVMGPGRLADEYVRSHGRKVEEVMTFDPVTVQEDTPLGEIVRIMERRHIKRVPVMRDNRMVGIVTRANLVHALASLAREAKAEPAADWALRDHILALLRREIWAPIASIDVTVRNGIVDLWGTILDERERKALIVAVENVPGVKEVHDHIAFVEPTTGMVIEAPDQSQANVHS